MTTTSSKLLFAAAALLVTSGAAFAELETVRIEHPNGPATYAYRQVSRPTTVAVYAGEQGAARATTESARPEKRTVVIHQGRGQTQRIQVENR
jgi:hypothetical protein